VLHRSVAQMPTYEYKCISCNISYEITEKLAEHTTPYCCGFMMQQVYGAPAIVFKGKGWGHQ
jgi:putative FmdB family regulatory protein